MIPNTNYRQKRRHSIAAFVDLMVPINIEARYPSYKEALSRGLNQEFCSNIISKTKELQLWIKSKL